MKRHDKKLHLNSDTIRLLASASLGGVRGAGPQTVPVTFYATCSDGCGGRSGGASCPAVCPWPPGGGGGTLGGGGSDVCGTEEPQ